MSSNYLKSVTEQLSNNLSVGPHQVTHFVGTFGAFIRNNLSAFFK